MWKVPLPEVGDIDEQLHAALVHKDGYVVHALTNLEREAISQLYAAYDERLGEPAAVLIPAALAGCADALYSAYREVQKDGRLKDLRGRLLAGVVECPLCGFAPAPTLDHFLPRETYRALAIYARNLVPTCQPCNRAKGTLQPVAGQGMVHPYFQVLPDEVFLHAEVDYDSGSLSVRFRIENDDMDADLIERLRSQYNRLQLDDRYPDPINVFLFNLKPSFLRLRGNENEKEELRDFLNFSAVVYDNDQQTNHWRAAVMRGLAACEPFLDDPWSYFSRPLEPAEAA